MIYGKTHKLTPAEREIYRAGHNEGEWYQTKVGFAAALVTMGIGYLFYKKNKGDVEYVMDYSEDE